MSSPLSLVELQVAGDLVVGVDGVGGSVVGLAAAGGVDGDLGLAGPAADLFGSCGVGVASQLDVWITGDAENEGGHGAE